MLFYCCPSTLSLNVCATRTYPSILVYLVKFSKTLRLVLPCMLFYCCPDTFSLNVHSTRLYPSISVCLVEILKNKLRLVLPYMFFYCCLSSLRLKFRATGSYPSILVCLVEFLKMLFLFYLICFSTVAQVPLAWMSAPPGHTLLS